MGYNPWGHRESNMTERLTLSLSRPRCLKNSFVCELNVPCQIFSGGDILFRGFSFWLTSGIFLELHI